ncbi:4Fe-4S binding protein [Chloroflexota bacterium]
MGENNAKVRADLIFNQEKCIGCGSCSIVCPTDAIEILKKKKSGSIYYNYEDCLYCRRCAYVCPEGAIKYTGSFDNARNPDGKDSETGSEDKFDFEYQVCPSCGSDSMPLPLMKKMLQALRDGNREMDAIITLCPECRTRELYERALGFGKKNDNS